MGINQDHVLGRVQRFYAIAESTFGTFVKPTGASAIKVLGSKIDIKQARKDRMDSRQTRSLLERITGKIDGSWSCETYEIPSGAAGTAPNALALFKAAFGVQTINAGTSVVYTFSDAQTGPGSISITRESAGILAETAFGAWVETFQMKISGGDEPRFMFDGGAANGTTTGTSTLNGAVTADTTAVVQTVDQESFGVGSVISIGGQVGADSKGLLVTAKTGPSLTVDQAFTASNGAVIIPFVPAEVTAGSPATIIDGSIVLDSVAIPITQFELTVKNGIKPIADEAFSAVVTDAIMGFREVSGSMTLRARKDQIIHLGKRKTFTPRVIQLIAGVTAGRKIKVDLPKAEIDFAAVDIPQSDEGTFQLPFKALATNGTAADECTLTFL